MKKERLIRGIQTGLASIITGLCLLLITACPENTVNPDPEQQDQGITKSITATQVTPITDQLQHIAVTLQANTPTALKDYALILVQKGTTPDFASEAIRAGNVPGIIIRDIPKDNPLAVKFLYTPAILNSVDSVFSTTENSRDGLLEPGTTYILYGMDTKKDSSILEELGVFTTSSLAPVYATELEPEKNIRHYYIVLQITAKETELNNYKLALTPRGAPFPDAATMKDARASGIFTRNISPERPDNLILFTTLNSGLSFDGRDPVYSQKNDNTIPGLLRPGTDYVLYGISSQEDAQVRKLGTYSTDQIAPEHFYGGNVPVTFLDSAITDYSFSIRSHEPIFIPSSFKTMDNFLLEEKYPSLQNIGQGEGLQGKWTIPDTQPVAIIWSPLYLPQSAYWYHAYTELEEALIPTPTAQEAQILTPADNLISSNIHLGMTITTPSQGSSKKIHNLVFYGTGDTHDVISLQNACVEQEDSVGYRLVRLEFDGADNAPATDPADEGPDPLSNSPTDPKTDPDPSIDNPVISDIDMPWATRPDPDINEIDGTADLDDGEKAVLVHEIDRTKSIRHYYIAVEVRANSSSTLTNYRMALVKNGKKAPTAKRLKDWSRTGVFTRNITSNTMNLILYTYIDSGIFFANRNPVISLDGNDVIPGLLEPGEEYTLYGITNEPDSAVQMLGSFTTDPVSDSNFTHASSRVEFLDPVIANTIFTVRKNEQIFLPSSFKTRSPQHPIGIYPSIPQQGEGMNSAWTMPMDQIISIVWSTNPVLTYKLATVVYTELEGAVIPGYEAQNASIVTPALDDMRSTNTHLGMMVKWPPEKNASGHRIMTVKRVVTYGTGSRVTLVNMANTSVISDAKLLFEEYTLPEGASLPNYEEREKDEGDVTFPDESSVYATELAREGNIRHYYILLSLISADNSAQNDYRLAVRKEDDPAPTSSQLKGSTDGVYVRNIPPSSSPPKYLLLYSEFADDYSVAGSSRIVTANDKGLFPGLLSPNTRYILYGLPDRTQAQVQKLGSFTTDPLLDSHFANPDLSVSFLDKEVDKNTYSIRSYEEVLYPLSLRIRENTPMTQQYAISPYIRINGILGKIFYDLFKFGGWSIPEDQIIHMDIGVSFSSLQPFAFTHVVFTPRENFIFETEEISSLWPAMEDLIEDEIRTVFPFPFFYPELNMWPTALLMAQYSNEGERSTNMYARMVLQHDPPASGAVVRGLAKIYASASVHDTNWLPSITFSREVKFQVE